MFYDGFESREDMCNQFGISDFEGVVIYASYECEGYEGSAEVMFINRGKIYTVSGGHCSCYGLEGQWQPEEMPVETLQSIAKKGDGPYSNNIRNALVILKRMNVDLENMDMVEMILKLSQ